MIVCKTSCNRIKSPKVTVSNNNPDGWMTGVVALVVLIVTLMTAAILSSCVGFSHKAKSRFWGSVHAG